MINNIELSEITDINLIQESDAESLFGVLWNSEDIKEKILKTFDDIYLLDVAPDEIDKYKWNKDVYNILKHYVHNNAAENMNLQIMFFKINKSWLSNMKELYTKYKEELWDMLVENKSKYYIIIWYFGGSTWRTNQYVIEEIKQKFDVINIK